MFAAVLLLLIFGCCAPAGSVLAAPFLVSDQNPLLAGVTPALPDIPPPPGESLLDLNLNVSNTLNRQGSPDGDEFLLLDEETVDFELHWRRRVDERWLLGVSVPWISRGGGRLDRFLSEYHRTLGLPNGDRSSQPDDRFLIRYQRRDGESLLLERPVSGFGDPSLLAGYLLREDERLVRAGYVRLGLPAGEEARLLGAGEPSLSGWLSSAWRPGATCSWTTDMGGLWFPGDRRGPAGERRVGAAFLSAALNRRIGPNLRLSSQLDWRSRIQREGRLKWLGSATLLTLGGQWRFHPGFWLVVAVTEDVQVSASPDVSLQFGLRMRLGGSDEDRLF